MFKFTIRQNLHLHLIKKKLKKNKMIYFVWYSLNNRCAQFIAASVDLKIAVQMSREQNVDEELEGMSHTFG